MFIMPFSVICLEVSNRFSTAAVANYYLKAYIRYHYFRIDNFMSNFHKKMGIFFSFSLTKVNEIEINYKLVWRAATATHYLNYRIWIVYEARGLRVSLYLSFIPRLSFAKPIFFFTSYGKTAHRLWPHRSNSHRTGNTGADKVTELKQWIFTNIFVKVEIDTKC